MNKDSVLMAQIEIEANNFVRILKNLSELISRFEVSEEKSEENLVALALVIERIGKEIDSLYPLPNAPKN